MRRLVPSVVAIALILSVGAGAKTATVVGSPGRIVERSFDTSLDPREMSDWMKSLASQPNHVGSPHDQQNAATLLGLFRRWGWDAHIETFEVLYPTPVSESLELVSPVRFKATLTEPPIPGDVTSTHTHDELPAYVAYQGDGDVTAPLIYVNYGTKADYDTLQTMGVSVSGKVVIARYGSGWRGVKAKLAQERGAIGCILYSDPQDDGYAVDDVYPNGPSRPPGGFQRGSVEDVALYPGDPLTPGTGATETSARLKIADAPTILKIPVLPISHADARHFLSVLHGPVAPAGWEGALPFTYHVGSGKTLVHLAVKSEWRLVPIHDVVAVMKGSTYPNQWVLRGNHYDAWVFGASDPMSGQVAMLSEAKAIGRLASRGWRPRRTIVYLGWDGEEPGLLGSTEWVETHAAELKQNAIAYINSDTNGRGFLAVSGSPSLQHLISRVAGDIEDPETGVSILQRKLAQLRFETSGLDDGDEDRTEAETAGEPLHDVPIAALGSGSDYGAFLDHLGIAVLHLGFGGERDVGGVYHSAYDTWEYYDRFADPGFRYATALAKLAGHTVLRLADARLPQTRYGDFAKAVSEYLAQVKKLADARREAANVQARLLSAGIYRLVADPENATATPILRKRVPEFDFTTLETAVRRLRRSANNYDAVLAAKGPYLPEAVSVELFSLAREVDQSLAPETGLPGRPWFKNLIYAPGDLTGYSAKTLPGIREAIEQERWSDVDRYIVITAAALNVCADRLDAAYRLVSSVAPDKATKGQ